MINFDELLNGRSLDDARIECAKYYIENKDDKIELSKCDFKFVMIGVIFDYMKIMCKDTNITDDDLNEESVFLAKLLSICPLFEEALFNDKYRKELIEDGKKSIFKGFTE